MRPGTLIEFGSPYIIEVNGYRKYVGFYMNKRKLASGRWELIVGFRMPGGKIEDGGRLNRISKNKSEIKELTRGNQEAIKQIFKLCAMMESKKEWRDKFTKALNGIRVDE
jgi:hypothetical protein